MRLLILTQKVDLEDPILGFFHRWIEELADHAERVHVVCLERGRFSLPRHVSVESLGKERGVGRAAYVRNFYSLIIPLLLYRRVDKIFIHMNEEYVLLLAPLFGVSRLRNIKLFWWKTHAILNLRTRLARFLVDVILTASEDSFPIRTPRKVIVGHGIDTSKFVPSGDNSRDRNSILSVGRISPIKHYEDVIHALPFLPSSVRLRIVGPAMDGRRSYAQELKDLAKRLGVDGRVTFEPPCTHCSMPELYHQASVVVNTSDTDSIDKVVLEAMACGVVPVTSNRAFSEALSRHGLFVEKRNVIALAKTLERVLSADDETREDLQEQLRAYVVKFHDLERLAMAVASL